MVWKPTKKQVVKGLAGVAIVSMSYGIGTLNDCGEEEANETNSQPVVVNGRTVAEGFANPEQLRLGFENLDGILAGGDENATYETFLTDSYFADTQEDGRPAFYAVQRSGDGGLRLQRIQRVTIEYTQPTPSEATE